MSTGAYYVMGDIKGGKSFRQSFATLLRHHGSPSPRVLYLGAACYNKLNLKASFEKGLAITCPGSVFKSLSLSQYMAWDHKDAQPERIEEQFSKADIVFFDGGGIRPLSETFKRFELGDYVRRAFERGAYVGGLCAGGSFMAEEVVFFEDGKLDTQKGAGLIEDTAISCHMNIVEQYEPRLGSLQKALQEGKANRAIGLADNQAVLFQNGNVCRLPVTSKVNTEPFTVDAKGRVASIDLVCV